MQRPDIFLSRLFPRLAAGLKKIAIIGGGPAGMSCAYFLALKGYKPTVFEKEARPGGMLMNGIPSFRLEKDVVEAEIDILRDWELSLNAALRWVRIHDS